MRHYLESVVKNHNPVINFALGYEKDIISDIDCYLNKFSISPQDAILFYESINKLINVKETIKLLDKEF